MSHSYISPRKGRLSKLDRMLSLDDFELAARRHLPTPIFGYISGAAEENRSLSENRSAFDDYTFLPRVLRDVSSRVASVPLFGQTWATPFGIAPMGSSAIAAYRADIVMARAAKTAGIPAILSGSSLIRMEDVIEAAPGTWFQAYLPGEMAQIEALIARVARAGYETLVVTADVPVMGNRENLIRAGFSTPLRPGLRLALQGLARPLWLAGTFLRTLRRHGMPHFENSFAERGAPIVARNVLRDFSQREHLNWDHVARIREVWSGNLVIKGVLSVDDARLARDHGADGIILSNHGGRQLDGAASPLRVLPEVVAAMGDWPVMIDSGFRRGTDVLKAVALGARMVFVGRPFVYAAAIGGEAGVARAIEILNSEVDRNLALLGVTDLGQVTQDLLVRR